MKKLMTLMLGLALVLGSTALFAGDTSTTKTTKTKKTKARRSSKAKNM